MISAGGSISAIFEFWECLVAVQPLDLIYDAVTADSVDEEVRNELEKLLRFVKVGRIRF